jgi:hypothetical protein
MTTAPMIGRFDVSGSNPQGGRVPQTSSRGERQYVDTERCNREQAVRVDG